MATRQQVLVTGATGFIGSRLTGALAATNAYTVRAATRRPQAVTGGAEAIQVNHVNAQTDWSSALADTDTVIHLAARVHVTRETSTTPLADYRAVNVAGTMALAEQAAARGVRRFIHLSTVKVHGPSTTGRRPFRADDPQAPEDAYAQSKAEAEAALLALASTTLMEIVILRPPLVYGPGVKGNFATMMRWLNRGVPLPLGHTNNRRSLLALDNLIDLIHTCINHPNAANSAFLAGDDDDLSTTELLRRIGDQLGRPARLIPVPRAAMHLAARLTGQEAIYHRLFGSLQTDITSTRQRLNWAPPLTVEQGLKVTTDAFRGH